ncbi:MAG: hypothetical protein ABF449_09745 [Ethanoligenens sp.]
MNVNLDKYWDEQKPTITVFGKEYAVDNDYKKVLGLQKFEADMATGKDVSREFLAFALVDGENAADDILAHKIPFAFFQTLYFGVTAAMTGQTYEDVKKAAKDAQKRATFRG